METVVDLGMQPVPGLFFEHPEAAASIATPVRVVRSAASGLVQLDVDLNADLYAHYKSAAWTPAHGAFVERLADDFLQRYPVTARILEIGGGAGHFMRALRGRGFHHLHVIDPSAENRPTDAYHVIHGHFPDALAASPHTYDVIVAQHFLEHCAEPVAVLRSMRDYLSATGDVWIEVPDITASSMMYGGVWLSMMYALHSSYFSADTLTAAGRAAGLHLRHVLGVNHYGKSLLARFGREETGESVVREQVMDTASTAVVEAIRRYFERLKDFGSAIPENLPCWGAAERCRTVLSGCMAGGFVPGPLIDGNPELHGLYLSGMTAPVVSPAAIEGPLEAVLILSPLHADAIVRGNPALFHSKTRVFVPTFS